MTVGSWAPKLLDGLVSLPRIRVTQEQPAHFQPVDDRVVWPSFLHHREIPSRRPDRYEMYGLLTPGEGVKVGEHGTGVAVDPDFRDFGPEPRRLERLKRYVEEWLPLVDPESAQPISCIYDISPSEDFVIKRVGPIVLATGFSGHGFKFTPEIGRMLADLADPRKGSSMRVRLPRRKRTRTLVSEDVS